MANIKDLIDKCDESEIMTQNLNNNATNCQIRGERGEITFVTDPQIVIEKLQGKGRVGIVIRFPPDVFER